MPRRQPPKKDAASCEKPRGAASKLRSVDIRLGEPVQGNAWTPANESIVCKEGTRGTETSKYPEEKKEKSIPLVVVSEEGEGQTDGFRIIGVAGRR